jgi:CelD/BcsL family acetyltransferase involved in cellulose biosynthesis
MVSMAFSSGDLETRVLRPDVLAEADAMAWRDLQAAEPAFASPLLGPDFARAVAAVRADARVAVFRRGGVAVGFLAFHRRPGGFARPIGAPFCDYHGLVASPEAGLDAARALRAAGLAALRLTGVVDPQGLFAEVTESRAWAHRIVLDRGADDHLEGVWRAHANARKNHRRYRRALEREAGPLRLVGDDRDPAAFARVLAWKRDQFRRTGLHDVLGAPWAWALMRRLFERREAGFGGQLISLYAGERLVAAHFGLRQGGWFHPWIGAFDVALKAHSPGMVHQVEAIAAMPALGLTTYDLGPGEDHWKGQFTTTGSWIGSGLATAPSVSGQLARSSHALWRWPARAAPLLGRVRNRLDQIAALELTLGGRMQGAAHALGAHRRRR